MRGPGAHKVARMSFTLNESCWHFPFLTMLLSSKLLVVNLCEALVLVLFVDLQFMIFTLGVIAPTKMLRIKI